jgi:hypothetical protein
MLISLTDIRKFKSITINTDNTRLENYIQEAQDFDLQPFLGNELYYDLIADKESSPSLATYGDLYNGSTYSIGNRTFKHVGIVPVLVYFTYARYLANQNVASTKYGMVVKTNDFSQPADSKTVQRLIDQAKSGALVYQDQVKQFLDYKNPRYPLWRGGINRKKGGIKITSVGGNSDDYRYYERRCSRCNGILGMCNCAILINY